MKERKEIKIAKLDQETTRSAEGKVASYINHRIHFRARYLQTISLVAAMEWHPVPSSHLSDQQARPPYRFYIGVPLQRKDMLIFALFFSISGLLGFTFAYASGWVSISGSKEQTKVAGFMSDETGRENCLNLCYASAKNTAVLGRRSSLSETRVRLPRYLIEGLKRYRNSSEIERICTRTDMHT